MSLSCAAIIFTFLCAQYGFGEIATQIPVTVNVVQGCDVNDAEIRAVIAEANKVMKQWMIGFEIKAINHGVTGGNPSGSISGTQEHGLVTKAMDELKTSNGGYNGMKIFYGNELRDDPNRWGQAYHADNGGQWYSVPVVWMKKRDGSATGKGNDLAHEFAHSLTLLGRKPVSGTADANSDNWGHMINPQDSDNLMYQYNADWAPRGKKLAPQQIKEIKENAMRFGRSAVVTPSHEFYNSMHPQDDIVFLHQPRVLWVDNPNETYTKPLYDDLAFGYFFAQSTTAGMVEMLFNLAGNFPPGPVNANLKVYLNVDNNPATGMTEPGYTGYDRIVDIQLDGQYPAVRTTAAVRTFTNGIIEYAPFAMTDPVLAFGDYLIGETGPVEIFCDSIFVMLPMQWLTVTAANVPVKIVYENMLEPGQGDDVVFVWDTTMPAEPIVEILTTPIRTTEPIAITGSGFTPMGPVEVFLDDELIAVIMANAEGQVNEILPWPAGKAYGRYFLTMRDSQTGLSGFSILTLFGRLGDVNYDREVNLSDLAIFAQDWLRSDPI